MVCAKSAPIAGWKGQPAGIVDGINTLPDFLRPPLD